MIKNSIHILLVEDNPGDIELTREAFSRGKLANQLHVAEDGVEALEFLFQQGAYSDAPCPDIILLDLNLPKKDGREVLAEIKANERTRQIPVLVLSSSEAAQDIKDMYNLHANCFITKPVTFDIFMEVVSAIKYFWIDVVKLPAQNRA